MVAAADRVKNRRGEGGRLRAEILRGAAELLDETGQEQAVTLRAVARQVGIAAPSIYSHFPDRQSILLAAVEQAFAELTEQLRAAQAAADTGPVPRLRAVSTAYLDFARLRPQRYRVMFGGVWDATDAAQAAAISHGQAVVLGQDALAVVVEALRDCVDAHDSTSTEPFDDAVALWVALHGLAHQCAVIPNFPWPNGIADRLVDRLAQLHPRHRRPATSPNGSPAKASGRSRDPAADAGEPMTQPPQPWNQHTGRRRETTHPLVTQRVVPRTSTAAPIGHPGVDTGSGTPAARASL